MGMVQLETVDAKQGCFLHVNQTNPYGTLSYEYDWGGGQ